MQVTFVCPPYFGMPQQIQVEISKLSSFGSGGASRGGGIAHVKSMARIDSGVLLSLR